MDKASSSSESRVVVRKARASQISKYISRFRGQISSYIFPIVRYTLMPGLMFVAINYTEPSITFFELINPFF